MIFLKIKTEPPQGIPEPNKWSKGMNNFISKCLTLDPEARPEAKELLEDPWLKENARGYSHLSELVEGCMHQIEEHRQRLAEEYSDEDEMTYRPGATVEIWDEGNTVEIHSNSSIVFKGENRGQEENKEKEPFFMQHFKKHGIDCEDKDKEIEYMKNFLNDYEDKERFANQNYVLNKEESKNPEIKEESKLSNFDLGILECKNKEPGEDKLSSTRKQNNPNMNAQQARQQRELEVSKRSGSVEETSKVSDEMINRSSLYASNRSDYKSIKHNEMKNAVQNDYSSSSDSYG